MLNEFTTETSAQWEIVDKFIILNLILLLKETVPCLLLLVALVIGHPSNNSKFLHTSCGICIMLIGYK